MSIRLEYLKPYDCRQVIYYHYIILFVLRIVTEAVIVYI